MDQDMQMNNEEILHFKNILRAFSLYEQQTLKWVWRQEKHYEMLSPLHKRLIPNHPQKLESMKSAVHANQSVLNEITQDSDLFQNQDLVI